MSAELAEKRYSVQNTTHSLHDHVIALTKAGAFAGAKGDARQSLRAQFDYYCHRMAANASQGRGFVRGEVMPGCTPTAVVAESIGVDRKTVQRNDRLLHEQGFIRIELRADGRRAIRIMTWDAASEAKRQANAGAHVYPYAGRSEAVKCAHCGGACPSSRARHCSESCKQKAKRARMLAVAARESDTVQGQDVAPPATRDTVNDTVCGQDVAHTLQSSYMSDIDEPESTSPTWERRQDLGEETAARPGRQSVRSQPEGESRSVEQDNWFWHGVGKDGKPYFTKVVNRGRWKSDIGQVELSVDQARKFFGLKKADETAWLQYKRELFGEFTTGQETGPADAPSARRLTADDYNADDELMDLANELASYGTWGHRGVQRFLRTCLASQDEPDDVISKLQHHLATQVA